MGHFERECTVLHIYYFLAVSGCIQIRQCASAYIIGHAVHAPTLLHVFSSRKVKISI